MKLFVGNLGLEVTEVQLEGSFSEYGQVKSINIIKDRETGSSRGFAFVEMKDRSAGLRAINGLNLQEIAGRVVTVNEARLRKERRW